MSIRYLLDRVLEAGGAGQTLLHDAISEEIAFRERCHNISKYSTYAAAKSTLSVKVPSNDADSILPLVGSIQTGTIASPHSGTVMWKCTWARVLVVVLFSLRMQYILSIP